MATKEKKTKNTRTHKESAGKNSGGGEVRLTELQKVLLVNGGMAHRLRGNKSLLSAPKTRKTRADKRAE